MTPPGRLMSGRVMKIKRGFAGDRRPLMKREAALRNRTGRDGGQDSRHGEVEISSFFLIIYTWEMREHEKDTGLKGQTQ